MKTGAAKSLPIGYGRADGYALSQEISFMCFAQSSVGDFKEIKKRVLLWPLCCKHSIGIVPGKNIENINGGNM
jgi:hypothetical protein